MALKDSLKHFADTDGYSSVLKKSDYDSNIDILADNIDTNKNDIATNNDNIDTNKNDIATNKNNIDTNTDNINDLQNNKMDKVIVNGDNFKRYLDNGIVSTSDDTETIIKNIGDLPVKSVVSIEIYSQNLQDDYATKWIFKGTIYAVVKDDNTITADKNLSDIVKDDTDWNFDIVANNGDDDTPANIDLKVTGKADTNINWSVFLDIKINNF